MHKLIFSLFAVCSIAPSAFSADVWNYTQNLSTGSVRVCVQGCKGARVNASLFCCPEVTSPVKDCEQAVNAPAAIALTVGDGLTCSSLYVPNCPKVRTNNIMVRLDTISGGKQGDYTWGYNPGIAGTNWFATNFFHSTIDCETAANVDDNSDVKVSAPLGPPPADSAVAAPMESQPSALSPVRSIEKATAIPQE